MKDKLTYGVVKFLVANINYSQVQRVQIPLDYLL